MRGRIIREMKSQEAESRRHSRSHGRVYCSNPTFGVTAERARCSGRDPFEGTWKNFKWLSELEGGVKRTSAAESSHLCLAVSGGREAERESFESCPNPNKKKVR